MDNDKKLGYIYLDFNYKWHLPDSLWVHAIDLYMRKNLRYQAVCHHFKISKCVRLQKKKTQPNIMTDQAKSTYSSMITARRISTLIQHNFYLTRYRQYKK